MALNAKQQTAVTTCDFCKGRKGRNHQVVHILKFTDRDDLEKHLKSVFAATEYCVHFYLTMWTTAHQFYGYIAREKYFPLWLVYLEANGVKVNNRADVIMRYRGRTPRQEEFGMEGMDL